MESAESYRGALYSPDVGGLSLGVLFTAFEPSGDAHAAVVVRALRQMEPGVRIYAFGGRHLAEAGAELLQRTADDGAMALGAWRKIPELRRAAKCMREVLTSHRIGVHVPVDSSSANFPLCRISRAAGKRVVHLVAPQLWASRPWRARTLRALTDRVLCLLPFEEAWFRSRQIPAFYIGHPAIHRPLDLEALSARGTGLPVGSPRIAILPGSRQSEVRANIGAMVSVYEALGGGHRRPAGVIALAHQGLAPTVHRWVPALPSSVTITAGRLDDVLHWCDLALVVSGTASLDVTRHTKPMVGMYRVSPMVALVAPLALTTRFRLLPNVVAEREIVPEFVPYCGGTGGITESAEGILADSRVAARMRADLQGVLQAFGDHNPGAEAAEHILRMLGGDHQRSR